MKASAILCSDLHLREDVPECRLDDFLKTQERKYAFLRQLSDDHNNPPVLCSGDVFHHWKPSPHLITFALRNLPPNFYCCVGQHDLSNHNILNLDKCGLQSLEEAGKVKILSGNTYWKNKDIDVAGFPYGTDLDTVEQPEKDHLKYIALIHYLVYQGKEPFPGAAAVGGNAKSILKKFPQFDLVVSGDNHTTCVEKVGKQLLVNPGSFTRQTAAQLDHKPCVFLYYAKENRVEQVFIPINKRAVTKTHLITQEEKDERMGTFVNRLKMDMEVGLSFESNLKQTIAKNKVSKSVQEIIWESVNG